MHVYADIKPLELLAHTAAGLNAAWYQLPTPVKVLASAVFVVRAAPAIRRAADSLGVEPLDLLRFIHGQYEADA